MSEFQDSFVDKLRYALQGEPLRAISYGATAAAWLAAKAAFSLGITQVDPPSFDQVGLAVAAAIATLTELARRFVYSPITVERVLEAAYSAGAQRAPLPDPERV